MLATSVWALLGASLLAAQPIPSLPRTLRVDFVHSGSSTEERCALEAVSIEGPWPGALSRTVGPTDLGPYVVEVLDAQSGGRRFARGFGSVFGEWRTTAEARSTSRAFQESVRFPEPPEPVDVVLKRRGPRGELSEIWRARVDPRDPAVDRARQADENRVEAVLDSGPTSEKIDLLLLGDGYTAAEREKFLSDARRLTEVLFRVAPFKQRRGDFNVWAVAPAAAESGISRPSDGVYRRSPLRFAYDALGMERYILGGDERRLRDVAAVAPYDVIVILVNERKYGGGGIYNLYATVAVDNAWAPYVFVHELGHTLAGLADEYFSSPVAYEAAVQRAEPWEPNVTADPRATRWLDLVSPGTPLPTLWPKSEYEALVKGFQERRKRIRANRQPESEMEALFAEERDRTSALLARAPFAGRVGAFEGALYESTGFYRPEIDCLMFSRNGLRFCAVCRRAIERVIDASTDSPRTARH